VVVEHALHGGAQFVVIDHCECPPSLGSSRQIVTGFKSASANPRFSLLYGKEK